MYLLCTVPITEGRYKNFVTLHLQFVAMVLNWS